MRLYAQHCLCHWVNVNNSASWRGKPAFFVTRRCPEISRFGVIGKTVGR